MTSAGPPAVYTDPATGFTSTSPNAGEPPTRLMTCVETTPGSGVCAGSNTGPNDLRGTLHDVDPKNPSTNPNTYSIVGRARLRNCTDPDLAANSPCMYYTAPGTAYSQVGDYLWFSRYGLLSNFKPNTGNTYSSNVTPLGYTIASVKTPGPALDYQTARKQGMADDFNFMLQPVGAGGTRARRQPVLSDAPMLISGDIVGQSGYDHLVVGSSLPWLLPFAVHHLERAVSALAEAPRRPVAALAERLRQAVDLEHWPAFGHSFEALAALLGQAATGAFGMPPCSISSPEKMKNGMARNENTFIPDVIIWIAVSNGSPSTTKVARQLRPIANATGTPSTRKATKLRHKTVNAMTTPPCFQ